MNEPKIALPVNLLNGKLSDRAKALAQPKHTGCVKVTELHPDYNALSEHVRRLNEQIIVNQLLMTLQ